jgi:hypothetical protein
MRFLDLVTMEPLAEPLAREHGKTIPDAKGDISAVSKWWSCLRRGPPDEGRI